MTGVGRKENIKGEASWQVAVAWVRERVACRPGAEAQLTGNRSGRNWGWLNNEEGEEN